MTGICYQGYPLGGAALHLVGGLHKLGIATEEDLRWLKKEFVSVWKSTPAGVKSLPQSNTSDYEQPKVVQSTFEKIRFNDNGS